MYCTTASFSLYVKPRFLAAGFKPASAFASSVRVSISASDIPPARRFEPDLLPFPRACEGVVPLPVLVSEAAAFVFPPGGIGRVELFFVDFWSCLASCSVGTLDRMD